MGSYMNYSYPFSWKLYFGRNGYQLAPYIHTKAPEIAAQDSDSETIMDSSDLVFFGFNRKTPRLNKASKDVDGGKLGDISRLDPRP